MRLVSTAAQVRALDRRVIEEVGVPGVALMETASHAVAGAIRRHHAGDAARGVVVVCGGGNNGGDGYGIARWLKGWGYPVATWSLKEASTGDAGRMRAAAGRLGVPEVDGPGEAGLLVDAVFGTGLDREVEGRYAEVLRAMDRHPAPVVAVDVPSGLHADTGAILGVGVRAARTVTFGRLKPGLLAEPGAELAGEVEVADIGLGVLSADAVAEVPDAADIAALWPRRAPGDHKTRAGHLLVAAGSVAMAGAAVLVCRGALSVGVGLLTLAVPRGAISRLGALPPEVMVVVAGEGDLLDPLPDEALARPNAIAAGPGLGGGGEVPEATCRWLEAIWGRAEVPVVFDADAMGRATGPGRGERLVTPHPGEAGRLLGSGAAAVQADRFEAARRLAVDGRAALLKGRHTLVAQEGHRVSVNPTGNALLATGGAGDVLTGMLGGLLARGLSARDAARAGAYVHGLAADLLLTQRGQGWTAGDVADAVPWAVEELRGVAP